MNKTAQFAASSKQRFALNESQVDRGGDYEMTENTTTQHLESIKGDDLLLNMNSVKPVPETAVSKEQTEIDRSEMQIDKEVDVKVNFPQLKLNPQMSKTAQQSNEMWTGGPFSKLNRIEDEEDWNAKTKHLKFDLKSTEQVNSPQNKTAEKVATNNFINEEDQGQ